MAPLMAISSPIGSFGRRRRHGPVVVLAAVLAVVAVVTWTVVLSTAGHSSRISCPAPASGQIPGEVLEVDALDATSPAPVDTVSVRVLNAGGQRGQANLVAAQLGDLGFREAAPPGNDPVHPDGDMECIGQLRFGPQGEAAAATLALVLPCTEPVRDGRGDASVDVVVGTEFREVDPSRAVRDVLDELANPAAVTAGADAGADETDPGADPAAAPARPAVPADVLDTARGDTC
jgi:hypothetical protein